MIVGDSCILLQRGKAYPDGLPVTQRFGLLGCWSMAPLPKEDLQDMQKSVRTAPFIPALGSNPKKQIAKCNQLRIRLWYVLRYLRQAKST